MKILLTIHHHLDPNTGAPGSTFKIGQEYRRLGHQVEFYSLDNLPHRLPNILKTLLFPEYVAAYLLKKGSFNVLDASTGDAWVWGNLLRNFKGQRPLLVTRSHGLEHIACHERLEEARRGNLHLSWKYPLYHGGYRLWEVKKSLRCADLVFLLNHHDFRFATKQLGVKPERVNIVANGITEAFINLSFEPTSELENSPISIAQVGSYIPRKGIQYSVPALNGILSRYPNTKVSFLGTGCPEKDVFADFNPAFQNRIQVVPQYQHEELPSLLRNHQITLFTPLSEGFGKVLIEAMACGLAPVTTAIPGPMEIVTNNYNGIFVPPRDSQAIERALEQLIGNRANLEHMRRNAYTTAQRYSWSCIAKERLYLYEKALKQKKCSLSRFKIS